MILVDANLLLYAYDQSSARHEQAKAWLEGALSGAEAVRFPWLTLVAFLRISTHRRVFARPLTPAEATAIVDSWLALPVAGVLEPGARHWEILRRLLDDGQARGPLVTDAHLAALALEFGATLHSCDRDFLRFDRLSLVDPLTSD